ncbi:hypothetical protein Tco_0018949 [Tanacetum coccineum]
MQGVVSKFYDFLKFANDSVYIQSWEYDDGRVVHYAQEAMLVSDIVMAEEVMVMMHKEPHKSSLVICAQHRSKHRLQGGKGDRPTFLGGLSVEYGNKVERGLLDPKESKLSEVGIKSANLHAGKCNISSKGLVFPVVKKDENLAYYIAKNNVLKPIVDAFICNGSRYNLLNSAVLDLFEHIREENIKILLKYLVETFWDQLVKFDRLPSIQALKVRYDQTRRRVDERALEKEEEDYFNESDEEDSASASASASTPRTTRVRAQPSTPKGSDASCPPYYGTDFQDIRLCNFYLSGAYTNLDTQIPLLPRFAEDESQLVLQTMDKDTRWRMVQICECQYDLSFVVLMMKSESDIEIGNQRRTPAIRRRQTDAEEQKMQHNKGRTKGLREGRSESIRMETGRRGGGFLNANENISVIIFFVCIILSFFPFFLFPPMWDIKQVYIVMQAVLYLNSRIDSLVSADFVFSISPMIRIRGLPSEKTWRDRLVGSHRDMKVGGLAEEALREVSRGNSSVAQVNLMATMCPEIVGYEKDPKPRDGT